MIPTWMKAKKQALNCTSFVQNKYQSAYRYITNDYKGNNISYALTVIITHIQYYNRCVLIVLGACISMSVLSLRFDTKYNIFTAEYSNVISNFALDISLLMFQLATIYAILYLFDKFHRGINRIRKDLFYESKY